MSKCLNEVTLIGYVGKKPDIKAFQNGDAVANFSLATSKSWKDKVTGENKDKTEWHRVVFYRKLAEVIGQYVGPGDKLFVRGEITSRKWKDKEGVERTSVEILGNELIMLGSKSGGIDGEKPRRSVPGAKSNDMMAPVEEHFDDDIPF